MAQFTLTMDSDDDSSADAMTPPPPPIDDRFTPLDALRLGVLYSCFWIVENRIVSPWQYLGPQKWYPGADTTVQEFVLNSLLVSAVAMHLPLAFRSTPFEVRTLSIARSLSSGQVQGLRLFV